MSIYSNITSTLFIIHFYLCFIFIYFIFFENSVKLFFSKNTAFLYVFFHILLILLNAILIFHRIPIKNLDFMFWYWRITFWADLKNKIEIRDDLNETNTTFSYSILPCSFECLISVFSTQIENTKCSHTKKWDTYQEMGHETLSDLVSFCIRRVCGILFLLLLRT